jgi:hypothetical protein
MILLSPLGVVWYQLIKRLYKPGYLHSASSAIGCE